MSKKKLGRGHEQRLDKTAARHDSMMIPGTSLSPVEAAKKHSFNRRSRLARGHS